MMKRIVLIFFTAVIAIISFNINNIYAAVIDEVRFEGNKRIPDTRITPYLTLPLINFYLQQVVQLIP